MLTATPWPRSIVVKFVAGELRPLVGVEDLRLDEAGDRLFDGFDTEVGGQRVGNAPRLGQNASLVFPSQLYEQPVLTSSCRPDIVRSLVEQGSLIDSSPHLTQRELARGMSVSLGKVNYCVNALIEKGWVKARSFRKSNNKLSYAYLLTPRGVEQKAVIALRFLQCKVAEYESLKKEIAGLRREVAVGRQPIVVTHDQETDR